MTLRLNTFQLFTTEGVLVMSEVFPAHYVANSNFLTYILDELMPWHADEGLNDYSLLEVNW